MRVVHLITTIDLGGAERQLLILARHQLKQGMKVEIIYLKGHGKLESLFRIKNIPVNNSLKNKNIFYQVLKLFFYLNWNFDVVHAHLSRSELFASLVTFKPKLVVSKHNSERLYPNGSALVSRLISNFINFRAVKIIAISDAVKKYLVEIGEITSIDKIQVVSYGYDDTINTRPKKIGKNQNLRFGTVCRLEKQKDVATILRAWSQFQHVYPKDSLYIVGSGSNEFELKKLSRELKLKKVFWIKSKLDLNSIYSKFDVFILSSHYEGFGLVLLEAISFKLPIIASNNSSIPEVLGEFHPGIFETGNSKELLKKMSDIHKKRVFEDTLSHGLKRKKEFNPETMTKKIATLYSGKS